MERLTNKLTSWLPPEEIEPQALAQANALAALPIVDRVALMPDCHLGKGATVGSVIATGSTIIPAAVGVDIGCGMIATETSLSASDLPDSLESLRQAIEAAVPTGIGVAGRNRILTDGALRRVNSLDTVRNLNVAHDPGYDGVDPDWRLQLGTLGGGNHFIEVCLDERDMVWVVLHSGSRGIGNKLAIEHIRKAKGLMDQLGQRLQDPDMAYFMEGTKDFNAYIGDLKWAQYFALLNREEMMDRVMRALRGQVPKAGELGRINCHHNFTQRETHGDRTLWITRKGAIEMQVGQLGVIPGSMGTRSYIVEGLGNEDSMRSAPHGAGRRMSRKQATKTFTMGDLEESMKGITARLRPNLIDEHPGAYKDIDVVMERSSELVKIRRTLRQVLNVKGD